MRNSSLLFLVGLVFILITDTILWIQIRQYLSQKWKILLYWLHSSFFLIALILYQFTVSRLKGPEAYFWIETFIGIFFLFYVPKVIFILFNGIGRLFRKVRYRFSRAMTFASALIAGLLFAVLLYSITWGRYNYKIERVNIPLADLPEAFDRVRIVQLSDIHLGSFGKNYPGIEKLVREVNSLHPDLIVFTGDMVNNFADEMPAWIPTMQKLEAKYGKYAVTGNHDYGDYTRWPSVQDKEENLRQFFENMQKMGFRMLNNTHVPIVVAHDTLWLAGVENWGKPPFPQYGNLTEAIGTLPNGQPILLLSHDPSHWRAEIVKNQIPLTLSGHTHAMQFGIKIGRKEWSPAQYIYPEYDGLYREGEHFLYVSRGQGYIGFPGRIGLRPVITEITLLPSGR